MRGETDPSATVKAIIDANLYMVLGIADEHGHPWVSSVYYAPSEELSARDSPIAIGWMTPKN